MRIQVIKGKQLKFIGATGDKRKDSIYLYLMKDTKKWQKRNTNIYPLGWALYFTV